MLASVPSWDWASIAHIHSLLHHWPTLPPVTALEMLDSKYAGPHAWRFKRSRPLCADVCLVSCLFSLDVCVGLQIQK